MAEIKHMDLFWGYRIPKRLIFVLILTAIIAVPFVAAQNNAMFRADQAHTGVYSADSAHLIPNTGVWQFSTGGWVTSTPAADKFSTVSTSKFHDSIVKKPDSSGVAVAYYWNDKYLTEQTKDRGPWDPVKLSRYVPSGSESYRIDTWLP